MSTTGYRRRLNPQYLKQQTDKLAHSRDRFSHHLKARWRSPPQASRTSDNLVFFANQLR
ncbi:MAG: hypothetical protein V7K40_06130 [Nostoc sp.]|uniref:hypothetical protein n=1 Tax=Nostoc sp. TaxID=1180 RepID=UPI002FFBC59B